MPIRGKKRAPIKGSSEVYGNLIEGAPDSIVALDLKGTITYCNKPTETLTGYAKQELIGKHFSRVGWIKNKDIPHYLKSFKELLKGKKVAPFEMEAKRRDGNSYWIEVHLSRIKTKGETTGFQVSIIDITERKKIETALIRKEKIATQRARLLNDLRSLDRIDDILTRVCEAVRDSELFERAVMTLHKPGGRICHLGQVGLPQGVVKRARQAPPIEDELRSRITSKKFRISDSFFIPAEAGLDFTKSNRYVPQKRRSSLGGDWQPGDELFVPLRNFSGEIMGYLSVDTPINGCRPDVKTIQALEMLVEAAAARVREVEAREDLKREHDLSQSILETANSLIVCLDADAKITVFNQECERVTGYRHEEVLGKRWPELFLPSEQRHAKLKSFAQWVRAHPCDRYEGPIVTKNGEIRTILWSNTAILGSGKKDVVAIAIGHDITERKQAEETLKESEQRFKAIFDNATDGILMVEPKTRKHLTGNRMICQMLGYSLEEIKNLRVADIHPRGSLSDDLRKFEKVLKREIVLSENVPVKRKDGSIFYADINTSLVELGGKTYLMGIFRDITERKRAEEKIEAERNKSRDILDGMVDGVGVVDVKGNFQQLNKAYVKMLGYKSPEELIGKPLFKIIAKKDLTRIRNHFREVVKKKERVIKNLEVTLRRKDGKEFPTRINIRQRWDEKGNLINSIGIIRDFSEHKRAEEALKASENKYRTLLENLPQKIFLKDKNSVYLSCNENFAQDLKIKAEEFAGKTDYDFFPKELAEKYRADDKRIMRLGKTEDIEEKYIQNGREVFVHTVKTPVKDERGNLIGLLGIFWDITDRKRTEEALRISQERYELCTKAAMVGVWDWDIKSNRFYIDPKIKKILGYKDEEIPNDIEVWVTYVHPEDREPVMAAAQACLDGKTPEYVFEHRMIHKDGSIRWILSRGSVIRDAKGNAVRMVGTDTEITERKQAEDALRESEEKFRTLAEQSPNMIFINKKSRVMYANKKCEEIMGYEREEFYSPDFDFLALIAPEYRELVETSFAKHIRGKDVGSIEYALVTKKGERIEAILSTKVIRYRGEKAILGIITDITERKRVEEALRIERDRLETVTQNAAVGLAIISKDYRTLWANEVLKRKFGDVEGKICYSTYNQRNEICPGCGVREVFETGRHEVVHDQVGKGIDGKTIWAQIVATPIKDKEGNITAALEVVVDITERKRVEEALRESEERFRTISTTAKDAILMIDNKGNISYWNPAAKEIFGYSGEEVIGKELHILLAPMRYHETYRKGFSKFKKAGRGVAVGKVLELEAVRKDGTEFPIELSLSAIKIKDQWHAVGIVRDITERKRAEEALQENEERYRSLFEDSPISLWEEDFSEVKKFINGLRAKGVKDFRKYFENHPEAVTKCAAMVKVIDVNNVSLKLFKAKSKEELQRNLGNTFSEESYDMFREELMAIAQDKNTFETEAVTQTLKSDKKHVFVRWSVAPGYEKTLSKILVSISDITELKRAREQNLLLETSKTLSRTLELDQVLKIGTEKIAKALRADRCSIALFDESTESAELKYLFIERSFPSPILPEKRTPPDEHFSKVKEILLTKGYLEVKNVKTVPIPTSVRNYLRGVGTKSFLVIPLIVDNKLFGVFHIGSVKKLRSFAPEEISLAQTIANQVAVAAQNTLLIEDLKKKHSQITQQSKTLERQYQEQGILMRISRELSKTLDLDRILEIATKEAAQALQVDRCAVALAFTEEGYAEIRSIYVKEGKPITRLLGYKLYSHNFPQAKEMFEKRKLIKVPNTHHLPDKSFAREYFIKEGIKSALFVPMVHGKKLVGFFVLSTMKDFKTFTREETKLAQTIADQTAVAIENARLLELVRKSSENLKTLSVQLINVQEDERKKIAQEMHDEIGQALFAMKMNLDMTKKNLPADIEEFENTKNRLNDTEHLLSQTIEGIRNLTTNLRPSMLDDFGLIPALKWYIENFSKRTNIKVYLKTKDFKLRLSSEVETTLYRVLQEALTNVAKHAQATEVSIVLARKNSFVSLSVEDNGMGFDTQKISFPKDRLGLFSIKERIKLLNGEFEIRSKANKGTKLSVKIPLAEGKM